MRRILFVDDEADVLEALRDALRSRRREWDMVFRVGGEAAFDELAAADYDVVVSDLGMPRIDGAALLEHVRQVRPVAVRVIMSGSVEGDVIARTAGVAHRLLAKPCDLVELTRVIERSCELHDLTRRESLRRAASGVGALPAVPETYVRIAALVDDPSAAAGDAAAVVEQDPAVAARVLQLANSAFFGGRQPITSLERAVTRIGLRALVTLTLSAGAYEAFASGMAETVRRHAALVARIAPRLLPADGARDDALAAGLLHDVGLLVLATQEPDYLGDALAVAARDQRPLTDVEYDQRGVSHAEIGAHLLALWGLPDSVVEAVAYHHRPHAAPAPALDTVAAVAIAEALAHGQQRDACPPLAEIDQDYLELIGVTHQLEAWQRLAADEASRN